MQTFESEKMIRLLDAVGLLPYPVSADTLYHWANHGVRGVRLRTTRVGARHYVWPSDVAAFVDAMNGGGAAEAVA